MGVGSLNDFKKLEILKTGTLTITDIGQDELKTVNLEHGLGFAPVTVVYWGRADNFYPLPYMEIPQERVLGSSGGYTVKLAIFSSFQITATILSVFVYSSTFEISGPISFKYYLMRETSEADTS